MQLATSTSQQSSLYQRDIRLSGGAHAVLLVHGLASTPLELRIVAKALHKHDFTTVVPYFPGYGNDSACASWQDWLAGVRAQFLALQATHTTVSLGGLCIGATLALALAIEQPVQSLALLSTTLQYDGWAIPYYHAHIPVEAWSTLAFGLVVASVSAFLAIWGLMRFLERFSTWPFVIYRAALGVFLIGAVYTGFLS